MYINHNIKLLINEILLQLTIHHGISKSKKPTHDSYDSCYQKNLYRLLVEHMLPFFNTPRNFLFNRSIQFVM